MTLDDEAADAIAIAWLKQVREDAQATLSDAKAHPGDVASDAMLRAACDVLLVYCGRTP